MILLLGSGGQLGQELTALAQRRGLALVGRTRAEIDIADRASVERALAMLRPSLVVNTAAYTKVDRAETEADEAFRANAIGPETLARACARISLPLIHISTDYVFDGTKTGAYRESDPVAPLGIYGRSKAAGEEAVRRYLARHVILRTAWVYGVYGANFLKTMLRLAAERDELRVVADQRGCPTSTADLAEAILAAARRLIESDDAYGTYHFAGTGATTWHGFASRIIEAQALHTSRRPRVMPIPTEEYPTPASRPANSELDSSLFVRTFGYTARPWAEAAEATVDHLFNPPSPAQTVAATGKHHEP